MDPGNLEEAVALYKIRGLCYGSGMRNEIEANQTWVRRAHSTGPKHSFRIFRELTEHREPHGTKWEIEWNDGVITEVSDWSIWSDYVLDEPEETLFDSLVEQLVSATGSSSIGMTEDGKVTMSLNEAERLILEIERAANLRNAVTDLTGRY